MNVNDNSCYICLAENSENHVLIHPCHCKWVHRDCLDQWRVQNPERGFYSCEVCRYEYRIQRLWWGRLLGYRATAIGFTIVSMGLGTVASGWLSSLTVNTVWYWWKILVNWLNHQEHVGVETPPWSGHRMQMLFHGLFWLTCLGIVQLVRNGSGVRPNIDWDAVHNRPGIIYRPIYISSPPQPAVEEKREEKREEKEEKKERKEKKVPWTYTSPSYGVWIAVLSGAALCGYHSYNWFRDRCVKWCQQAQERIENV